MCTAVSSDQKRVSDTIRKPNGYFVYCMCRISLGAGAPLGGVLGEIEAGIKATQEGVRTVRAHAKGMCYRKSVQKINANGKPDQD